MTVRYALSELAANWRDYRWVRNRFRAHVVGRLLKNRGGDVPSVMELDWDILIILDACRWDTYREMVEGFEFGGNLGSRQAVGTGTPEFLEKTFGGGTFHDTVYVTGNSYVETELAAGTFHAVDHVWVDGWDEEVGTVRPSVMAERGLQAAKQYPKKRIIVHLTQPHTPYIGEPRVGSRTGSRNRNKALGVEETIEAVDPFELLRRGEVTEAEVLAAYRDNLRLALESVERLVSDVEGRVAITADHGEAFGDRAWPFPMKIYGHPIGVRIPALTMVPWHVIDTGPRRKLASDPPGKTETQPATSEDIIEDRLEALGYR